MIFKKSYKVLLATFLALCMVFAAMPLQAKVTVEEAERLKKDLTPMGSERAGNADGTIPEWTGGLTKIPDNVNYDPSKGWRLPDPFADEKVLFTITAQNMDQYADKLAPGLKAMLKKYPDTFKMNIYPTHRTAAYPQWVNDNTYLNALEGELIGDGSDGITGCAGGFPFPISTNGSEMFYNHVYRFAGKAMLATGKTFVIYPDGSRTVAGEPHTYIKFPYFILPRDEYIANEMDIIGTKMFAYWISPARTKGQLLLGLTPSVFTKQIGMAWMYTPGTRRARRAPNIAYDCPNPQYAGLGFYDEMGGFAGQPDRYDWSFKGRKEMYIPYNCFKYEATPAEKLDDMLTPYHMNPEYMRYELHRVYEVHADLKQGKRHSYKKRVFFMDEDTYVMAVCDKYDNQDTLWRLTMNYSKQMYQEPADRVHYRIMSYDFHDFQTDTYAFAGILHESENGRLMDLPDSMFTVDHLRKIGRR